MIKSAVLNTFNEDEVAEARQTMIDNVKDIIPDGQYTHKRRDSPNRPASDVMMDDIMDMFKALDSVDQSAVVKPRFVSDDAARIPGGPEESGNMMSMYQDISAHQRQLQKLQETLSNVIKDVAQNSVEINHIKKCQATHGKVTGAPKVSQRASNGANQQQDQQQDEQQRQQRGLQQDQQRDEQGNQQRDEHQRQQRGQQQDQQRDEQRNQQRGQQQMEVATVNTDLDMNTVPPCEGDHTQRKYAAALMKRQPTITGDDDFQTVGPNNNRRPNRGRNKAISGAADKKRSTKVAGTADNSSLLLAGPETFQVQITNVSPTLTTTDITNYVEGKVDGVKPSNVEDISSDGWSTKRFLLTFEYKHHELILSQDFWPKRIFFKRWFTNKEKVHSSKL